MIRKEWFRPKKLRVLLAWTSVPFLIYYANIGDTSYRCGAVLMALGELIRLWSLGFVEKKGQKLAVNGPYAFTRNPLYVGNFFLGLGIVVMAANWIIALLFLIGFFFVYLGTIRSEEKDLEERFGPPYQEYCKNVPRLFPRLISLAPRLEISTKIAHHEMILH